MVLILQLKSIYSRHNVDATNGFNKCKQIIKNQFYVHVLLNHVDFITITYYEKKYLKKHLKFIKRTEK